jgi:hypothetical protein
LHLRQLDTLKKTGSVAEYYARFEQLAHSILLYNGSYDDLYLVTRFFFFGGGGGLKRKFVHLLHCIVLKMSILLALLPCYRRRIWSPGSMLALKNLTHVTLEAEQSGFLCFG